MTVRSRIVAREPMADHDGRSGALLERGRLDDGTAVVIKTATPANDLTLVATGNVDRELRLFVTGALGRLGDGVGHPILDVWREGDVVTTVMRDLGSSIPGWSRVLGADEVERVMAALGALHRSFLGAPPEDLCPLESRVALLGRDAMGRVPPGVGGELPELVLRGWERFEALVPAPVSAAVFAVHRDPTHLADALRATGPSTLCHADLWPVNLALDAAEVVFLDWALATEAPPVLDLVIWLNGSAAHIACGREAAIESFRAHSPSCSDDAVRLGLFAGLCDMGWNKALDAAEHEDPRQRRVAAEDLAWWVARSESSITTP